jgi:(p)ppGpp synthase/HD superfamily hydrolase
MYTDRFDRALVFASEVHRNQIRKGSGVPYVTHLLVVASIVGEHHGTEAQVVAALLHDAIEDCIQDVPDIREQIEARFGADVLAIVEACTDADTHPKPPWRERKEAYLARLREKPAEHPALLVSLADKVHNSRSILRDYRQIGDELWERFRGGHEGTLWYYRSLSDIFAARRPGPLATEFEQIVDSIHEG